MKVYYHSALIDAELTPNNVFRTIPCKACLEFHKEKMESSCKILYNGTLIDSDTKEITCNVEADLIVEQNGERYVYSVRPLIQPLSIKYAETYEKFSSEYRNMELDEISSIQHGTLKLYAIDQSADVHNYTEIFDQISNAFYAFKTICEKPKSHLKAVNEVRPIETVKRIGYESIPYLAAHSEDWLARTASGLKPARLFSRVEDDEYQIYENRVVKTLIDLILSFLKKVEKQFRDQRDQLRGIMNSSVQTGSFGFDVNFQRAVSELMRADDKGSEYSSKSLGQVEKLQAEANLLLKHYRILRQTKLYRYLKNTKPVLNPLNETNILTMDKYYSIILKLWKAIHFMVASKTIKEKNSISFDNTCDAYQQFCATLCGYATHVLDFKLVDNGHYIRNADHIDLMISCSKDGMVHVVLKDIEPRTCQLPPSIKLPIAAGMHAGRFAYNGYSLSWPNDITKDEIDDFCGLFKTRESRGKEQSEENYRYTELKKFVDEKERLCGTPRKEEFVILPLAIELEPENRTLFKAEMEIVAQKYLLKNLETEIIVAMPICNENEQKTVVYAKENGQHISLLPLTMFDINSFRRIQNVLYRKILKLKSGKKSCPNCGGKLRERGNQLICDSCNQLTLTKTICPHPECRHEYTYMGYDVPTVTLEKMHNVQRDSFFEWDGLYQYKDVVNMSIESGKIRTICPYCHQS